VIAVDDLAPAYIPLGHRYIGAPAPPVASDLLPLHAVLGDPAVAKIVHDSKTVIRAFAIAGGAVDGIVEDTMLAAFLLDPTAEAEPGEAAVERLGGMLLPTRATIAGKARSSLETVPVERAAPWAGAILRRALSDEPDALVRDAVAAALDAAAGERAC